MAARRSTAGERHSALTDKGVVALREALDGLVEAGRAGSLAHGGHIDLLARDGDVLCDGARKQERFLKYHADIFAQIGRADVVDVHAADAYSTVFGRRLIELVKQEHHRRFAAASAAEDAEDGACRHSEVDVV